MKLDQNRPGMIFVVLFPLLEFKRFLGLREPLNDPQRY